MAGPSDMVERLWDWGGQNCWHVLPGGVVLGKSLYPPGTSVLQMQIIILRVVVGVPGPWEMTSVAPALWRCVVNCTPLYPCKLILLKTPRDLFPCRQENLENASLSFVVQFVRMNFLTQLDAV